MKKILVLMMVFALVFSVASVSFAAYDILMKGIVTKVDGNEVTIKDDKGKEAKANGNARGIKNGDKIVIIKEAQSQYILTEEDVALLDQLKPTFTKEEIRLYKDVKSAEPEDMPKFFTTRKYFRALKDKFPYGNIDPKNAPFAADDVMYRYTLTEEEGRTLFDIKLEQLKKIY